MTIFAILSKNSLIYISRTYLSAVLIFLKLIALLLSFITIDTLVDCFALCFLISFITITFYFWVGEHYQGT